MSRSGYAYDYDMDFSMVRWRGTVARAIRGKRGQAFLREMLAALDALPERRLIAGALAVEPGDAEDAACGVCAIGSVGHERGVNMAALDPEDYDGIAGEFGIAAALVREIEFVNDEGTYRAETPEERFVRVREWVASQIRPARAEAQS